MNDELLETWRIAARVTLDGLDEAQLSAQPGSRGRSVAAQLAHIYNVRLMWVKSAAPELLEGLEKFESAPLPERTALRIAGAPLDRTISYGMWEWGVR